MPATAAQYKIDFKHSSYSAADATASLGSLQSLSEKEETEKELDFELELVFIVLPFLASDIVTTSGLTVSHNDVELNTTISEPAYLLHANFRI